MNLLLRKNKAQNLFFQPAPYTQSQPCFQNSHKSHLERGSEEGKEKRNGEEGGDEVVDDHETSSDFCRRDLLEE